MFFGQPLSRLKKESQRVEKQGENNRKRWAGQGKGVLYRTNKGYRDVSVWLRVGVVGVLSGISGLSGVFFQEFGLSSLDNEKDVLQGS